MFPIGHPTSTYCKDIPITSDADLEDDHEFSVTITAAGSDPHATIGTRTTITITILDDESKQLNLGTLTFAQKYSRKHTYLAAMREGLIIMG